MWSARCCCQLLWQAVPGKVGNYYFERLALWTFGSVAGPKQRLPQTEELVFLLQLLWQRVPGKVCAPNVECSPLWAEVES